jgi:hypothetical protein
VLTSNNLNALIDQGFGIHIRLACPQRGLSTDYGRPMKPFFIEIQNLGLGRQIGQINSAAFGVFSAKLFGLQRIRDLAFVCP